MAAVLAVAGGSWWWQDRDVRHYLSLEPAAFAARFEPPSPADSPATRLELDELLQIQRTRTPEQVAAARADRKTDVHRFFGALGLDADSPPHLPELERLAEIVEDDLRIQVRGAKERFRRLRPYEIEPRLEPCIDDVRGDLSYPSGHAAYAYAMYRLLAGIVPEREPELRARAEEFARQRMVCGVHFPSDLVAGDRAAGMVFAELERSAQYRRDLAGAAAELRGALRLPPRPSGSN